MLLSHVKRGFAGGVVVSTCSWINEKTPERLKNVRKTIASQVCCDSLLDYAENGFKVLRIQTTLKRYIVKGQYVLSCTSGVDLTVRTGIVLIPEACRIIGTVTPFGFMIVGGSVLDAFLVPELDKWVLLDSARVIRFNNLVEQVPKSIQKNGGAAVVSKVKQFLDIKGGESTKYVLRPRPGTPLYQDPTSIFYKPIFKLKPLADNYGVLEWVPVTD